MDMSKNVQKHKLNVNTYDGSKEEIIETPIQDPRPKKQRVFNEYKNAIEDIPKINRCLDELSRLFQQTTQGCSAVSLIDETIIIADNAIGAGAHMEKGSESVKVKLIRKVMEYFADLSNEKNASADSAEKVFADVCLVGIQGVAKGNILLDDRIILDISKFILNNYAKTNASESWRELYVEEIDKDEAFKRPFLAYAYEQCGLLARDFIKIQKYIEENKKDEKNELIAAFKGTEYDPIRVDNCGGIEERDYGIIKREKNAGFIILNIDETGVHAEVKVIEYLIFTGVFADLQEGEKVYVGVSKLCCIGCSNFIKTVNIVFGNKIEVVEVRGTHESQTNWKQPIISNKDYIEDRVEGIKYVVTTEQVENLDKLTPALQKTKSEDNFYSTQYSSSSPGSSPYSKTNKDDISNLDDFQVAQEFFKRYSAMLDYDTRLMLLEKIGKHLKSKGEQDQGLSEKAIKETEWYDYQAIKDSLIKKGIISDSFLGCIKDINQLKTSLENIKKESFNYILLLNVNVLDGSFTDINHWVGLCITTNGKAEISEINYLDPVGQKINQKLLEEVLKITGINITDTTVGIGVQFAYESENKIEIIGNSNDCGPMLVQLIFELFTEGKIISKSLSKEESAQFGQKCREEQSYEVETDNVNSLYDEQQTEQDIQKLSGESL